MKKLLAVWALYWQPFPRMPQIRNVPEPFIFWTAVCWNVPALRFPDGSMPKCLSGCFPTGRIKPGRWRPRKSLILNFGRKRIPKPKTNFIASRSSRKKGKRRCRQPDGWYRNLRAGMSPSLPVIRLTKCLIKGLVGIVNPKLNVTEPSAYFWKSDEKSPVFLGQYLFFQNSNKKMIALVERYFEDDPAMLEQIRQRRWLGKGGGVAALFAFVAEHYVPQQEQE